MTPVVIPAYPIAAIHLPLGEMEAVRMPSVSFACATVSPAKTFELVSNMLDVHMTIKKRRHIANIEGILKLAN